MADVEITYNNTKIVELSESGTKTLKTAGKYLEGDIVMTYESPDGTVVTNSDASVTLTLANNKIYQLTNSAVTDLTFSGVATGFKYAVLTFTSGSTATTFAMPNSGWYCVGADCTSGTFFPATSMRYNLAIEQEADRIAVYVMEAL